MFLFNEGRIQTPMFKRFCILGMSFNEKPKPSSKYKWENIVNRFTDKHQVSIPGKMLLKL